MLRPSIDHGRVRARLRAATADGPRALLMAALARTVYRRLDWWEIRIDGPLPEPDDLLPLEGGFLDASDVDELSSFRPGFAREAVVERFRRGERCFGVRLEGRLITTVWLAPQVARIEYLGLSVRLPPGTAYWYDSWTHPSARGLRLASACSLLSCRPAAAEGIGVAAGAVLPENKAGALNAQRIGMHPVGTIGWVGIGPLRRPFRRRRRGA